VNRLESEFLPELRRDQPRTCHAKLNRLAPMRRHQHGIKTAAPQLRGEPSSGSGRVPNGFQGPDTDNPSAMVLESEDQVDGDTSPRHDVAVLRRWQEPYAGTYVVEPLNSDEGPCRCHEHRDTTAVKVGDVFVGIRDHGAVRSKTPKAGNNSVTHKPSNLRSCWLTRRFKRRVNGPPRDHRGPSLTQRASGRGILGFRTAQEVRRFGTVGRSEADTDRVTHATSLCGLSGPRGASTPRGRSASDGRRGRPSTQRASRVAILAARVEGDRPMALTYCGAGSYAPRRYHQGINMTPSRRPRRRRKSLRGGEIGIRTRGGV
jgi:hypothetical protein